MHNRLRRRNRFNLLQYRNAIQSDLVDPDLVYPHIQYPDGKPREQNVIWDFTEEKLFVKPGLIFQLGQEKW